jgi:23S rRNA-/tRNA-specific pseudouridylate synthase
VSEVNWQSVLFHEEKNFVIINKPATIPVHSTEDNLTENVLSQLRKVLDQELWVTHRLDTSVSGLMVLAKNNKFQVEFNQLIKDRKVSKFYRALVERKPEAQVFKHFMSPEEKLPKKLELEPRKGWLECSLEILNVNLWGTEAEKEFWELEIELHTGRTHQIRAQLSKIGSPILGDKMYRGRNRAGFTRSRLALHSSRLVWGDSTGKHQFEIEPSFKLR